MSDRRSFLTSAAAGILVVGCGNAPRTGPVMTRLDDDEEITPVEDLMREHGVLRRVMYLYDDAAQRLDANTELPLDALAAGASVIHRVLENHHQKLEEEFLFPLYEKASKLTDLTAVLRRQHESGRALTTQITTLAKTTLSDADRATLATVLRSFNHMIRPHSTREDTVLFPALRGLIGKQAYQDLGGQLKDKERVMLGDHGFEHTVDEVARLEQAFGLDDLEKLTV